MANKIKSIVIVGGGTAGWLTAGTLAAKNRDNNAEGITITLVESPNIPIVGVGEGTWPSMRRTLKSMGIRETDFVRECDVSFKQGAKFAKWATGAEDDFYYHPLVQPDSFDSANLAPHWLSANNHLSFTDAVCPQGAICENSLAPKQISTPEFTGLANYAYHLNAGTFAEFLKRHCVNNLHVRHVSDDVVAVNSAGNGDINSVATSQNGELQGDLFIDCTGFKSLLLGQHYQVPFISCKDVLFLDTALAVQVPYADDNSEIASHTISTAQEAGWIWDIGLSTRRGVGHVYASKYSSEEHAREALKAYVKPSFKNVDELTIRKIEINPGCRETFWHRNCVAVGLSAGFLEPLEASALVLVEMSAAMIAEQMPATREAMDIVAKRFNSTFNYRWARIIDFLKLHYVLSSRTDSQFWIDNRNPETIPESLLELLDLWKYQTPWHDDFVHAAEVFPAASYQYVLYGMGFQTEPSLLCMSEKNKSQAKQQFAHNQKITAALLSTLPGNRELINKIHQYGLQRI